MVNRPKVHSSRGMAGFKAPLRAMLLFSWDRGDETISLCPAFHNKTMTLKRGVLRVAALPASVTQSESFCGASLRNIRMGKRLSVYPLVYSLTIAGCVLAHALLDSGSCGTNGREWYTLSYPGGTSPLRYIHCGWHHMAVWNPTAMPGGVWTREEKKTKPQRKTCFPWISARHWPQGRRARGL